MHDCGNLLNVPGSFRSPHAHKTQALNRLLKNECVACLHRRKLCNSCCWDPQRMCHRLHGWCTGLPCWTLHLQTSNRVCTLHCSRSLHRCWLAAAWTTALGGLTCCHLDLRGWKVRVVLPPAPAACWHLGCEDPSFLYFSYTFCKAREATHLLWLAVMPQNHILISYAAQISRLPTLAAVTIIAGS